MFDRLIKLVRKEKVSLFIGSGFSLEAGAPSVSKLCDAILSQIDDKDQRNNHRSDSLKDLSNYYVEEICSGSRNSLIELLQKEFQFSPSKMDDHISLSRIPHFHTIITTNYDSLLEDSYSRSECHVIRTDKDCAYIDQNVVNIFKIHGDFINQDNVVITSKDYDSFFNDKPNPQLWTEIQHHFLTENILFIGYSLKDDNIIDIINNISTSVGRNMKEMFLIAPDLIPSEQGKLMKMGIHYYDSTATQFLAELHKELNNNIWNDYKHKSLNTETFMKYCHLHNIDPTVSVLDGKENIIKSYKSLDGKALKRKISMDVNPNHYDIIQNLDFYKHGKIIDKIPFPKIPVIPIEESDLSNFSLRVNDILVEDKVKSIFLAPTYRKFNLTIRIPSKSFLGKTEAIIYSPTANIIELQIDCISYEITVTFAAPATIEEFNNISTKCIITLKKEYKNNDEAIKWIDLLCAFFSDEAIYVNEYSKDRPIDFAFIDHKEPYKQMYNQIKQYYQNLREIELLTGNTFSSYNEYSDESYLYSCKYLSFIKKECTKIVSITGCSFSTVIETSSLESKDLEVGKKKVAIATLEKQEEFTLNGNKFPALYGLVLFNPLLITGIDNDKLGKSIVHYYCDSKDAKYVFSDKPLENETLSIKDLQYFFNPQNNH